MVKFIQASDIPGVNDWRPHGIFAENMKQEVRMPYYSKCAHESNELKHWVVGKYWVVVVHWVVLKYWVVGKHWLVG